jgi:FkbM family methyltransferase
MADGGGITLSRCRHGTLMHPAGDRYIGRSLELLGEYSEGEVRLFAQLVKPGAVVVEAGANLGALTLPLARLVGPTGRVHAFEPQRMVNYLLCGNVAMNSLDQVTVHHAALGAAPGETSIPPFSLSGRGNYGGVSVGGDGEAVAVRTIDQLCLDRLAFVKIDVEGEELHVLDGARATVARCRPALYLENDRREKSPELISAIRDMGYRLWWHLPPLWNPANFRAATDNPFGNTISVNMLCLPAERQIEVRDMRQVAGPEDWWKLA